MQSSWNARSVNWLTNLKMGFQGLMQWMSPDAPAVLVGSDRSTQEVISLVFLTKLALQFQPWKTARGRPRWRWGEQDNLNANGLRAIYNVDDDNDDDDENMMHQ
jgi:hypothetical protein